MKVYQMNFYCITTKTFTKTPTKQYINKTKGIKIQLIDDNQNETTMSLDTKNTLKLKKELDKIVRTIKRESK